VKPKVGPLLALSLVREFRPATPDRRPIVVDGARELVPLLARELRAGGDDSAVREGGDPSGAAALVWIGKADEERLRRASRAGIPIVGLTEGESLPYVLDTDLVVVRPGEGMPVEGVARVLARTLGERGIGLAQRLPALREPVIDDLIRRASRRNAAIAAAVWVPGLDMPILTLNQLRLVLRIALASGEEVGPARLPELAGVVGAAFGFRTIARQLLGLVPFAGWATRASIAYAGTRSIGEAAKRRYSLGRLPRSGG
jgi:uncharacterized protein (DUF697 family)